MIKPESLKKGDKIAIVSLSWGGLGDDKFIHKYAIAKERLEKDFHGIFRYNGISFYDE